MFEAGLMQRDFVIWWGAEERRGNPKVADRRFLAIEEKLKRQRDFVIWWDSEERRGNPIVTGQKQLKEYGLDPGIVFKWRQRLTDDDKYESYKESAIDKAIRA